MQKLTDKIKEQVRPFWAVMLLAAGLLGCEAEEACVSQSTNRFVPGFYILNEEGEVAAGAYNFEKISAIGSDSIFYWHPTGVIREGVPVNVAGLEGIYLSLNPEADTTTFVFSYGEESEVLSVRYERTFRMISPDCGLEIQYKNLDVFYHTFDSVNVLQSELSATTTGFDVVIYESNSDCDTLSTNQFDAGFFKVEGGEAVPTSLTFDEISAVETDSLFTLGTEGDLPLLLSPTTDTTTFLFENTAATQIDTLQLAYTRTFDILSPECGLDIRYSQLEVTKSTFDSVSILNTELKSTEGLDVQIFN